MFRFAPLPMLLAVLAILGATSELAAAQAPGRSLDVTAPAPVPPPLHFRLQPVMPLERLEQQGIREQEFYPGTVRSRHEPAFVTPLVTTVPVSRSSGIRIGLSGWTAPAVPFDIPQATGGVAFGLTIVWGVPLGEAAPAPPESSGQR